MIFMSNNSNMSELLNLIQIESFPIVSETIHFWLYECSIDASPSKEEVIEWYEILMKRGGKFMQLANICQTWINEEWS